MSVIDENGNRRLVPAISPSADPTWDYRDVGKDVERRGDERFVERVCCGVRNKVRLFTNAEASMEDVQKVQEWVGEQFDNAVNTLLWSKFIDPENPRVEGGGDKPMPDKKSAIEIFSNINGYETEVIKNMEKPVFQMVPVAQMSRYITALDSNLPIEGQTELTVVPYLARRWGLMDNREGINPLYDNIVGWRTAITEGVKEPKQFETEQCFYEVDVLLNWFRENYGTRGIEGVDLKRMMLLMMDGMKRGEVINDSFSKGGTSTLVTEGSLNGLEYVKAMWWGDFGEKHYALGVRNVRDRLGYETVIRPSIERRFGKTT